MKVKSNQTEKQLRVVIDTNVWISAALSPSSVPANLVNTVLSQGLPVFSVETFEELKSRLWKPKFDAYISIESRQRILHDLNALADWVEIPSDLAEQTYSRDVDDDKFIHTAIAAGTNWLVTGDNDLLGLAGSPLLSQLHIMSPADALKQLEIAVGLK